MSDSPLKYFIKLFNTKIINKLSSSTSMERIFGIEFLLNYGNTYKFDEIMEKSLEKSNDKYISLTYKEFVKISDFFLNEYKDLRNSMRLALFRGFFHKVICVLLKNKNIKNKEKIIKNFTDIFFDFYEDKYKYPLGITTTATDTSPEGRKLNSLDKICRDKNHVRNETDSNGKNDYGLGYDQYNRKNVFVILLDFTLNARPSNFKKMNNPYLLKKQNKWLLRTFISITLNDYNYKINKINLAVSYTLFKYCKEINAPRKNDFSFKSLLKEFDIKMYPSIYRLCKFTGAWGGISNFCTEYAVSIKNKKIKEKVYKKILEDNKKRLNYFAKVTQTIKDKDERDLAMKALFKHLKGRKSITTTYFFKEVSKNEKKYPYLVRYLVEYNESELKAYYIKEDLK